MDKDLSDKIDYLLASVTSEQQSEADQIKSKKRVEDHGEVFTPSATVRSMLDLVKEESERIDSRFLEPACGSGNFLIPVLQRKLETAKKRYSHSSFEEEQYSLLALMSIYGIELLEDNVEECRQNLLITLSRSLHLSEDMARAAEAVLRLNIINGDALKMKTTHEEDIVFSEWGYLGKGKFQRREFTLNTLTLSSTFSDSNSLFSSMERHEIFMPIKTHPPLRISDLAMI